MLLKEKHRVEGRLVTETRRVGRVSFLRTKVCRVSKLLTRALFRDDDSLAEGSQTVGCNPS